MSDVTINGVSTNGLTQQQKDAFTQSVPAIGTHGSTDPARLPAGDLVDSLFRLGGVPVSYTSNATANTEDTVTHNLGRVPKGYIVVNNGNGGVVYNGGGTNTASTISLKCTTASNAVTLYVF